MTLKRIPVLLLIILTLILIQSCSLLKVQMGTEAVPLNHKEIKARRMLSDYAKTFFHEVRSAADTIFDNTDTRQVQINALMWKIGATSEAKNKIFQDDPTVALIDTWILTGTMSDYFKSDKGKDVFKEYQNIAVSTSDSLLFKIDTIARAVFEEEYLKAKTFVDRSRAKRSFKKYDFYLESAFDEWYKYQKVSDSIMNENKGTMPQVLKDFSNKMIMGSEQTIHQAQWAAELMLKKSSLDSLNIQKISDDFNKNLDQMINVIRESGKTMQSDAKVFHRDFKLLVRNVNQNIDSVSLMFREELHLFRKDLATEREAVMLSIDKTSNNVAKTIMDEFHDMVKDLMVYIIIFMIIVLVVPFTIGFYTGKIIYKSKDKEDKT